jgi:hypothetical protein
LGAVGRHEQRAGGGVNAKTAGNPAKQTASGGTVCIAQYHNKLHFFESLVVLCYTPFAWISAVYAESGDSIVRAGFLVLFIREKYGKTLNKINLLLFLLS